MSFAKFTQVLLLLFAGLAAIAAVSPAQAQTETVLYNFQGSSDGRAPQAGLISDSQGTFYGTTTFGGAPGASGTVFELSPNGGGGGIDADGSDPSGGLILDIAGNLYGTTAGGGNPNYCVGIGGCGVVFKVTP